MQRRPVLDVGVTQMSVRTSQTLLRDVKKLAVAVLSSS